MISATGHTFIRLKLMQSESDQETVIDTACMEVGENPLVQSINS